MEISERGALPQLSDSQINRLIQQVAEYVQSQRETYRQRATPLDANQKALMAPFFPQSVWSSTHDMPLSLFRGGYVGALERITSGDPNTMEAAMCFLECRPYFFRSGYMFKDILRRCRRAPLSPKQAIRLRAIEEKLAELRKRKLSKKMK